MGGGSCTRDARAPFVYSPLLPPTPAGAGSARRVPARGEPRPRSPGRPAGGSSPSEGPTFPFPLSGCPRSAVPPAPPAALPRRAARGGRGRAAPAAPSPPSPASSSCRHWLKVCSCRSFISPLVRRNLEMKPTAAAISRIMLARVYRAGCMEAAADGSQVSGAAGAGAGRGAGRAVRDGTGAARL